MLPRGAAPVFHPTIISVSPFLNNREAAALQGLQRFQHLLQHLRGMAFPLFHCSDNPEWIVRAIGPGWISGESLVRQIRIVLKGSGRLDDVDVATTVVPRQRYGEFGAPDCRLQQS